MSDKVEQLIEDRLNETKIDPLSQKMFKKGVHLFNQGMSIKGWEDATEEQIEKAVFETMVAYAKSKSKAAVNQFLFHIPDKPSAWAELVRDVVEGGFGKLKK